MATRIIRSTPKIADTTQEQIAGALACLDALRDARKTTESNSDQTDEQYFQRRDAAMELIASAAGPVSPRAVGVLLTLAELAIENFQNGYTISECLDTGWQPDSSMTAAEVAARRARFASNCCERCGSMNARAKGSQTDGMDVTDIAEYTKYPPFGDLSSDLNHELLYLRDFTEMAEDRANNHASDGKLVAPMDAAMPRLKLVMKIAEQLDGKIKRLSGELEELEPVEAA